MFRWNMPSAKSSSIDKTDAVRSDTIISFPPIRMIGVWKAMVKKGFRSIGMFGMQIIM